LWISTKSSTSDCTEFVKVSATRSRTAPALPPPGGIVGWQRLHRGDSHLEGPGLCGLLRCTVHSGNPLQGVRRSSGCHDVPHHRPFQGRPGEVKVLRVIVQMDCGHDNVDIKAACELGIAVCNIPTAAWKLIPPSATSSICTSGTCGSTRLCQKA
jgi:hypothetical protein